MKNTTARLLLAAAALLLLAGAIFAFMKLCLYAALLGAGIVPGRDCVVNAARRHAVSPIIEF